jgi:ornithine cyclodeaminase/alanine dehydrogenase-like protein (mu-crystallin family)
MRGFIAAVVTAAAAGLGLAASSTARAAAPASDRVQVGFIGLGGQGTNRLNEFMRQNDVDAAAVCDLDSQHLERAAALVEKQQGRKPATFHDFRKLLELNDVNVVVNATPDHWHTLVNIAAVKAGKDVYSEKPPLFHRRRRHGQCRTQVCAHQAMGNHIHNDALPIGAWWK